MSARKKYGKKSIKALFDICRKNPFSEIRIMIQNGIPVHLEKIRDLKKQNK